MSDFSESNPNDFGADQLGEPQQRHPIDPLPDIQKKTHPSRSLLPDSNLLGHLHDTEQSALRESQARLSPIKNEVVK